MKLLFATLLLSCAAMAQTQSSVTATTGNWYGIPYTNVQAVSVVPETPMEYLVCNFMAMQFTPGVFGAITATCSTIQAQKNQGASISAQVQASDSWYYYQSFGVTQADVQMIPNGPGQVCISVAPFTGIQPKWCGQL